MPDSTHTPFRFMSVHSALYHSLYSLLSFSLNQGWSWWMSGRVSFPFLILNVSIRGSIMWEHTFSVGELIRIDWFDGSRGEVFTFSTPRLIMEASFGRLSWGAGKISHGLGLTRRKEGHWALNDSLWGRKRMASDGYRGLFYHVIFWARTSFRSRISGIFSYS